MSTPHQEIRENQEKYKIQTEYAQFFSIIESNLPKTREMASVGHEAISRAVFPAYLEIRKYLLGISENQVRDSAFLAGQKAMVEKINILIKMRLKYCEEQNGRDYCKNCGLCEEDLFSLQTLEDNLNKS